VYGEAPKSPAAQRGGGEVVRGQADVGLVGPLAAVAGLQLQAVASRGVQRDAGLEHRLLAVEAGVAAAVELLEA
jgi:hypothetical protein